MLRDPRRLALVLLAVHVAATTTARANPTQHDALVVSRIVQLTNVAAFTILAGILHRSGSLKRWPNLLPLAAALGSIFGFGALLSFATTLSSSSSAFLWSIGAFSFISTAYYAVTPEAEGWMRHVGIAIFLIVGVPIMYALPRLVANRARPDKHLVEAALEASSLAYGGNRSEMFRDAEYLSDASTGTQVGIMSAAAPDGTRDIYIAFAGSTSLTDWLKTNIRVEDASYPPDWPCDAKGSGNVKVHAGFLEAYKSVREKAWNLVSDFILRTAASGRIIVCGHSLGGSMATIAALDIMCKLEPVHKPKVHVVSFGASHVGDAAFVKLFDSTIPYALRVVTLYDPVPSILTAKYVHVKGTYTVTIPFFDNPLMPSSAHKLRTYTKALAASSNALFRGASAALPLVLTAFFLVVFYSLSANHQTF
jgi:hypothetical protein